jgi:hypothetical protein
MHVVRQSLATVCDDSNGPGIAIDASGREDAMGPKLNRDELDALQSLNPGMAEPAARLREGDLPQKLYAFNLVARHPCGTTVLTKNGERALFGQACFAALDAIERGEAVELVDDVRKWLMVSGFVDAGAAAAVTDSPRITSRGQLWLASFKEEAASASPPITAADFARRRGPVRRAR